jgi:F0F1-type ATP synthase assembly protein I
MAGPVKLARQALFVQAIVLAFCALLGLVWGLIGSFSLMIGGASAFFPAMIFLLIFGRKPKDGRDALGFLRWYFSAEFAKIVLSIALLVLAFNVPGARPVWIIGGFLPVLAAGWAGLVIGGLRRAGNGT